MTAGVEWMATANPLYGKPPPAQHSISANSLIPVMGAARFKPAGRREKRRNQPLIDTDKKQRNVLQVELFSLAKASLRFACLKRSSIAFEMSAYLV